MTNRSKTGENRFTEKCRLNRAGYVHVAGWVTAKKAAIISAEIEKHKADVERIKATRLTAPQQ